MDDGCDTRNRPSGHNLSDDFDTPQEKGSIPPNLLEIANTASNTHYLNACRTTNTDPHPPRLPRPPPQFFIKFLTTEHDLVLDIFAGSNMTGRVAQTHDRHWLAFDNNHDYLTNSKLRFTHPQDLDTT
jgi:site-specific DNA-methyltransferase (cytosine-N4-specific)